MTPLLTQHSPSLFFLLDYYYNDEIGLSPVYGNKIVDSRGLCAFEAANKHDTVDGNALDLISAPFYLPPETITAMCIRPDTMEYDELIIFPEYSK